MVAAVSTAKEPALEMRVSKSPDNIHVCGLVRVGTAETKMDEVSLRSAGRLLLALATEIKGRNTKI